MSLIAARFLSAEDLDLATLSDADFLRLAHAAFRTAQCSRPDDAHVYSHGSLAVEPDFEHLLPAVRNGVL